MTATAHTVTIRESLDKRGTWTGYYVAACACGFTVRHERAHAVIMGITDAHVAEALAAQATR